MIDFRCSSCNKLLRVQDDKAGAHAKCPVCGSTLQIPIESISEEQIKSPRVSEDDHTSAGAGSAEYDSHSGSQVCPFCAETIKRAAIKCRFCGESLRSGDLPTKFDLGKVLTVTTDLYKQHFGLCLGTTWATNLLPCLFLIPVLPGIFRIQQPGQSDESRIAIGAGLVACYLMMILTQVLLMGGVHHFNLKLVRREAVVFRDIFLPRHHVWRLLGFSVVFGTMYVLGALACVIPGILVLMIYWPAWFILLDEDCGVFESLRRAKQLTDRNWLNSFLVGLLFMAIQYAGAFAVYIGLIFAVPFANLFLAASYLTIKKQQAHECE